MVQVCSRPLCCRYYAPLLSIATFTRHGLLAAALAGSLLLLLLGGHPPPSRPLLATLAGARFASADAAILLEGTAASTATAATPYSTVVAAWAWSSNTSAPPPQGPGVGRAAASNWSVTPLFFIAEGGGAGGEGGSGSGGGNNKSGNNNNNNTNNGPPDALRFEATLTPLDAAGNGSAALAAAVLSAKVAIRLSLALRVGGGGGDSDEGAVVLSSVPAVAYASSSSPLPGRALWAEGDLRLEQPDGELRLGLRRRRRRAAEEGEPRLTRYQRRAAEFWRALAGVGVGDEEEEGQEEGDRMPAFEEDEAEGLPPLLSVAPASSSSFSALDLLAATGDPSLAASFHGQGRVANNNSNNNKNRLRASFAPSLATWVAIAPGEPWRPQRAGPPSPSSTPFRVSLTVRLPKRPLLLVRPSRADALLWAWARFWAVWAALGGVASGLGVCAVRRGGLWAARASDVSGPAWRF